MRVRNRPARGGGAPIRGCAGRDIDEKKRGGGIRDPHLKSIRLEGDREGEELPAQARARGALIVGFVVERGAHRDETLEQAVLAG